MGGGRRRLNRIEDEKVRKTTFKNRSKGLMKKVSEISTKCEVDACLIIYDKDSNAPTMTFPNDTRVVKSMLEKYEVQKHEKPPKISDLKDYYNRRMGMCEAEISKVKKEILKIKYPTMDPSCFNNTGKEQLRDFIAKIDAKIGACNQRISMLNPQRQFIPAHHMIMNPHNGMEQFRYIQNMAQRQIVASSSVSHHPNQFSFMQNIPHMIMQPHNSDRNGMVGFTNQVGVTLDSINLLFEAMSWPVFHSFPHYQFMQPPEDHK